jgi:hypothetical protein
MNPQRLGIACIFIVVWSACAKRGPLLAPEDLVPPAVADLAAKLNEGNVELTWTRPKPKGARMTGALAIRAFSVQRACEQEETQGFVTIERIELQDQFRLRQQRRFRVVDRVPPGLLPCNYRVVAENGYGYLSLPSNLVRIEIQRQGSP